MSNASQHWTDEQMLHHLYGLPAGEVQHLRECRHCSAHLTAMQESRRTVEQLSVDRVPPDVLAAQRRKIYARIEERRQWWQGLPVHHWLPAACALLVLSGGFAAWEHKDAFSHPPQQQLEGAKISDAELDQQVSEVADSAEPAAAEPLRALFED